MLGCRLPNYCVLPWTSTPLAARTPLPRVCRALGHFTFSPRHHTVFCIPRVAPSPLWLLKTSLECLGHRKRGARCKQELVCFLPSAA